MAHLLEMKNICKSFSGVSVLKNNHLELEAGEVHALLGENGAGKSTLIKILGGVYTKDSGQILVDGQEVEITGVESAKEHGIRIIHQELMLIPDMTISEMVFVPSAGQYIPMDATLLMRMVSEWKIMTKRMLIALSIRTWKSSCLFNQWTM